MPAASRQCGRSMAASPATGFMATGCTWAASSSTRRCAGFARGLAEATLSDKPDTRGLQFLTRRRTSRAGAMRPRAADTSSRSTPSAMPPMRRSSRPMSSLRRNIPATGAGGSSISRSSIPADIPRLKPAGIIASMQPTHQTSDRLMAEARLGPDRLKGAYAWQTVEKLGIPIAFGSDFPVESPNPFPGLAAAVSRQDMNGQPPGGWRPEERVTLRAGTSRLHPRRGLCRLRGGEDRQPRSRQMGRFHPRRPRYQQGRSAGRWPGPRCWRPGSPGKKVWAKRA